jgi:hypothetical protein
MVYDPLVPRFSKLNKKWKVIDPNLKIIEEFRHKCLAKEFVKKRFPFEDLKFVSETELEILILKRELHCEENADYLDKAKIKSIQEKIDALQESK